MNDQQEEIVQVDKIQEDGRKLHWLVPFWIFAILIGVGVLVYAYRIFFMYFLPI